MTCILLTKLRQEFQNTPFVEGVGQAVGQMTGDGRRRSQLQNGPWQPQRLKYIQGLCTFNVC